jgi:2-polyprenyl-3-methyl-5-hydroxy-6-metoxy-1,4-benzoquinol methylase
VEFLVMDAENITLDKKFDVIIFNNIIGYLDNIQDVLYAIKKNCHEHTRVIISYYNHWWEPILNFGETIGYKKKSPQQNWLDAKTIFQICYTCLALKRTEAITDVYCCQSIFRFYRGL